MSLEFTGERVVPGQVDRDLWNEHIARYAFAARLARNRRVLDIACGTGYGTSELACVAAQVSGIDIALDAVRFAKENFAKPNAEWVSASATQLPFAGNSFDLVVAFEVIEHLSDWPALLSEARRVLAPGGQFVVSTPNRAYYAEARSLSGPNPYHQHEFSFSEFRAALKDVFPHVALFLEDHTEGVLIQGVGTRGATDVRFEVTAADPDSANFYLAVCAMTPQTGAPTFIYVPSSANILKERGLHIQQLQTYLDTALREHSELVERFREQKTELERSNRWAGELDEQLARASARIEALQAELDQMAQGYREKVRELEEENVRRLEWARGLEQQVEERTGWAQRLERDRTELEQRIARFEASRWVRLGRTFGVGPELGKPRHAGNA
jgi:SAM-dependent methyltransferase